MLPPAVAEQYPHSYAAVDVETTGLDPARDRILQIAVSQMRSDGVLERSWSSLVDPGCDPGPTHIHGITKERLRGAPRYDDIVDRVHSLINGRIFVAHNARFDWAFLAHEADRVRSRLPVQKTLCTWRMSGMFDLPVPDLKLATICRYWGVPQARPHDAEDDVRVLVEVTRHSLAYSSFLKLALPVSRPRPIGGYPPAAPRVVCPWPYPGRHMPGQPLKQGMTVVFTGVTAMDRADLIQEATDAGLAVMNNVSSRTSLLVANLEETTLKARRAREHGTSVLTEPEYRSLLATIEAGDSVPPAVPRVQEKKRPTVMPRVVDGPLRGHRVIVLGSEHDHAVAVRARIVEFGGECAVNLTASVTSAVALEGFETDSRWSRVRASGLELLDPESLRPMTVTHAQAEVAHPLTTGIPMVRADPVVLPRGGVHDLRSTDLVLAVRWQADAIQGVVDVVALVTGEDGQVGSDADFCFYNQPSHPSRIVELDADAVGEAVIAIDASQLAPLHRITVAAAIDGTGTFGELGAIEMELRTRDGEPLARSILDAAEKETTMLLTRIYWRSGQLRARAIGQGYQQSLEWLAVQYGVDIEDSVTGPNAAPR
nr:exonuclease domain-containing protein [Flexivirga aerilata]